VGTVTDPDWWRTAAIYQIYPRSFADEDRDGYGDLHGLRNRLDYLRDLGVDGIWISPWYPSPMADGGYDVADYRGIDPLFGTLADAERVIAEAHDHGLRVIIDIVPNHCSDAHPWFQAALAAGPGSPERDLFYFRPGRGEKGELPPNDWQSVFGGPAWQRVKDGEWYLHLFAPEQPDWNWDSPLVRTEFESILRFWLDRGVDGFRIDVADHLVKAEGLPEQVEGQPAPQYDQEGVHDIYRAWRRIADSYPGQRIFVGEIWSERHDRYLRPDELQTAFNFRYLATPWDAAAFRSVIDDTLASHSSTGAAATWVLSNHDVVRHVTRYGRADTANREVLPTRTPVDLALGTRRARAAALLTHALPGCAYVYQGEELGLWEVEDIPDELLQDPVWKRSGHTNRGRDGCRVPLPWDGLDSPSWLPRPAAWRGMSAAEQAGDPTSMLALYRDVLRLRRDIEGPLAWRPSPPGVLDFTRGEGFACVVNLSDADAPRPDGEIILASGPLGPDALPPDTAVWVSR
jgi:alpha-glucosidase